jgi:hypothetical protein
MCICYLGKKLLTFLLTPHRGKQLIVVDVAAGNGYYGLIGAAYGYKTIFVEPQPHCLRYLEVGITMSNFNNISWVIQVHLCALSIFFFLFLFFLNSCSVHDLILPKSMVGNDTALTATVEERNGCLNTWPFVNEEEKKLVSNIYGDKYGFQTVGTRQAFHCSNKRIFHIRFDAISDGSMTLWIQRNTLYCSCE